jgi:hypothetical protein
MNIFIFERPDQNLFSFDDLAFNTAFVVVVCLCAKLLEGEKNVPLQMAASCLCYVILVNIWPL